MLGESRTAGEVQTINCLSINSIDKKFISSFVSSNGFNIFQISNSRDISISNADFRKIGCNLLSYWNDTRKKEMDIQIINLTQNIDSINTSEAYSKHVFICKDNIVIPYINLEIFDNKLIPNNRKQEKIDFAYIILKGVAQVEWMYRSKEKNRIIGELLNLPGQPNKTDYFAVGNLNKDESGELKIKFSEVFVCISFISKTGKQWTPIDTPNFSSNLNKEKVNLFVDKYTIPRDVLSLLNCSHENLKKIEFTTNVNVAREEEISFSWTDF